MGEFRLNLDQKAYYLMAVTETTNKFSLECYMSSQNHKRDDFVHFLITLKSLII